ncbi:MAG: hypothetical protein ACJAUD_001267, partial [Crocinitomicaceae bacterium]
CFWTFQRIEFFIRNHNCVVHQVFVIRVSINSCTTESLKVGVHRSVQCHKFSFFFVFSFHQIVCSYLVDVLTLRKVTLGVKVFSKKNTSLLPGRRLLTFLLKLKSKLTLSKTVLMKNLSLN